MHVHDELFRKRFGALIGHFWRGRFGAAHRIERPIGIIHGDKGRCHPCRGFEKGAPQHTVLGCQRGAVLLEARLEFPLLRCLQRGHEFVARHRLRRNR